MTGDPTNEDAEYPADPEAWLQAGRSWLAAGDYERALEALWYACDFDSELSEAHVELGELLIRLGRDAEALPVLERARELGADDAKVHRQLAQAYGRIGDFAGSAHAWRETLQRNAVESDAQAALGVALSILSLQDDAVRILERIASAFPSAAEHAVNVGVACRRARNLPSARAAFEAALAIHPGLTKAMTGLGSVNLDQKRYDEAIACFEKAVAAEPSTARHHVHLAIAHHRKGNKDGARAAWLKAAMLSPDDEIIQRALSELKLEISAGVPQKSQGSGEHSVFAGELDHLALPDLLQLLRAQRASGLLVLESERGQAAFSFRDGDLVGAVTPAVQADGGKPLVERVAAALGETLTWSSGRFAFYRATEPVDPALESVDAQHALFDAIRVADEAGR